MSSGRSVRYFEAAARGIGPNTLRKSNQRAVLTVVATEPGCSNARIARRTGLAPQTVSAVLADLEDAGILSRGKVQRNGGRGQPATPVFINPDGARAFGIEIGWKRLNVVMVNMGGQVIRSVGITYEYPDARVLFGRISQMVADIGEADPRIIGVGLALPSGIGEQDCFPSAPPELVASWAGIDIVEAVAAASGYEVNLVNDGSAACWAELVTWESPRPGNFVYLLLDEFVGAGIVSEDRLWEGVTGASANLGSMLVTDRQGTSRFVQEIAAIFVLKQRLAAAGFAFEAAVTDSAPAAANALVGAWIEDAAFALAQTIVNARTVFEFEFAIIDSILPRPLVERLVAAIGREIEAVPSLGRIRPGVRIGHLGRAAGAEGAAFLRIYRRFFSREIIHMES